MFIVGYGSSTYETLSPYNFIAYKYQIGHAMKLLNPLLETNENNSKLMKLMIPSMIVN